MKITANIDIAVLGKEAKTSTSTGRESYTLAILRDRKLETFLV